MVPFSASLKIHPVSMHGTRPKTDMECGGKVLLPVSVLHALTSRLAFQQGPMLFTISLGAKSTNCGVLEFIAEEGIMNAPSWIFDSLSANVGDAVQISSISLNKATFARFQPQNTDFLDISDPRAVMENHLRGFACLTEGDVIPIFYNNRSYPLKIDPTLRSGSSDSSSGSIAKFGPTKPFIVLLLPKVQETRPDRAVCINECDMEVDFSPPVGYVEKRQDGKPREEIVHGGSIAFSGVGHRLDGKKGKTPESIKRVVPVSQVGQPNYEWRVGTLDFFRKEDNENNRPQSSRSVN